MLLSTVLCLLAINASRRVVQHWVALQRWLAGPQGSALGTTVALTIGNMLGATRCRGSMQLASEGSSVIHVDQLVYVLVYEI